MPAIAALVSLLLHRHRFLEMQFRSLRACMASVGRVVVCAVAAVVLVLSIAAPAAAQMHVTRNVGDGRYDATVADSLAANARPAALVMRTSAYADLSRGYGSIGDEGAWNVKLAARIDIARLTRRTRLALDLGAELTANPYNTTRFNPRAIFAEPGLTIMHRSDFAEWAVTVFHRCRHDVDNLDARDDRDTATDTTRLKRVIVLSGLRLGLATRAFRVSGTDVRGWSARAWSGVESYPVRYETRGSPARTRPDWRDAQGALTLGGIVERTSAGSIAPYARALTTLVRFRGAGSGVRSGARIEPGMRVRGERGSAELFTAVERTFDDLSVVGPQPSTVLSIGLRFGDRGFF